MTIKNTLRYAVIAPALAVTLVACSSSDDDNDDGITGAGAGAGSEIDESGASEGADANAGADPAAPILLFDEASNGDIVNDPNNPLPLQFVIGENRVNGAVISPDLDYLTVNVPAGSALTAIELVDYTSSDDRSFIAIQPGSVFTEPADAPNVENILGYAHFAIDQVGQDILSEMGTGEGAQGFTPPLEDGDYTFWIQETGALLVNYGFIFVVEAN